ncbi:PDGLE domain-containing protein [Methermicoccus shengliensis]|uniref:PDGLE domain-containing protein n=1 Tax=Methermicoccus shengliensis TaxID=660064 RepID=A0A832RYC1_9EURY|nr:PDGLE domain-containing protein [Methermicoccus shengliensis]KUK04912.1 MAG: hypothetical protein XD46_0443 [Euryarchaeota archaeon 55_53]KUK30440.1 MAG: hypothetical protein XD62_0511 [Methanosarcinales archeaon 56_1174]MDI3488639.1 cobalt/nickel transport protein [Methanosarcinales archaeon]MDN5295306.1 cobalt/nickel transport protein [Methanosarcinales archaeon]HIH69606.1 hypothetical protein [Methermicoccus shengliensis]
MGMKWWHWGLIISLLMAGGLSVFASPLPDGLERVAEDLGFIHAAEELVPAPAPDYTIPGVGGAISGSLAGIIGTLLMFALVWGIASLMSSRREG